MSLQQRWTQTLDELRQQDRFRSFSKPLGHDFTSNDYLGYGHHAPLASGGEGLGVKGKTQLSHSGLSSRLLRGHHEIWDEVEARLATWHGCEAVLMMTSGYSANEGLLSTVIEPGDWVVMDKLCHACIHDGLRLAKCRTMTFHHNDVTHLEELLKAEANKNYRQRFVIVESMYSMDGDLADLQQICDVADRYGANVIVDEAHTTGCYNKNGSGCVDAVGVRERILASVHTGGKALGVMGAYIAGSRLLKDYLINRCRHLIFTTALPPICGAWWLTMLDRIDSDIDTRNRLRENAQCFRTILSDNGISPIGTEYVIPIILGDNTTAMNAARKLQQRGYDMRAIRPPSVPPGTSRIRISIHADMPLPLIEEAAHAVVDVIRS